VRTREFEDDQLFCVWGLDACCNSVRETDTAVSRWSGLDGVRGIASRKGNTCSLLTSFRPSWAGLVGAARLTQRNQLKGLQKIVKLRETVRCHSSFIDDTPSHRFAYRTRPTTNLRPLPIDIRCGIGRSRSR
jgi:hypothetical protein